LNAAARQSERPLALVTGAALRVGRATCLALARAGLDVHFTYRTSADEAEELARTLRLIQPVSGEPGTNVTTSRLDLDDPAAVDEFAKGLAEGPRGVDVLVHNASAYGPSPLDMLSAEEALRHYRINALAPLLLTRRLAARLGESQMRGGGAVVCMCDIHASERPRKNFVAYNMSKAALEQMVLTLAMDLAPKVRVNGVAPGAVAFPEAGYESDPQMQERYLKRVPMGRVGTVEEAAEAVRWLALDATYTTGMIVRVDGGRWLA
jgi:pteridine reductase